MALLCAACTQNVDPVGDGTGGDGGTGAGTSSATNGGAGNLGQGGADGGSSQGGSGNAGTGGGAANAIAMLFSEIPDIGTGGSGSSSVATGPEPDPNTLLVQISDIPIQCESPYDLPCGGHFTVSFSLPVELQHPGIYPLDQINGFVSMTGDEPVDCSGGGGSWWEGEVEITAIDGRHVAGVFSNTDTSWGDANGPFDALRCF